MDDVADAWATMQQATFQPSEAIRRTLADRFGVPPFSVLDARQGYWQARKNQWLALGIQSELGRGEAAACMDDGAWQGEHAYNSRANIGKSKGLLYKSQAHLTALQRGISEEDAEGLQSGTSIFDPVLCELAYRWFCPPEGEVLDPFAGGSVRGIVAAVVGRDYTGIELSIAQLEANEEQARTIVPDRRPTWVEGDARDVAALAPGEYDFLFSCPPYGDLERYSDDPRDLSAMRHGVFLKAYREIVAASVLLLKYHRFACFVVGDFRDKDGLCRNFVGSTVKAFEDAGARLYNEAILVTVAGSLPIRAGKQFEAGRKLGKTHQNMLIFVKGDPELATAALGEVAWDGSLAPEQVTASPDRVEETGFV